MYACPTLRPAKACFEAIATRLMWGDSNSRCGRIAYRKGIWLEITSLQRISSSSQSCPFHSHAMIKSSAIPRRFIKFQSLAKPHGSGSQLVLCQSVLSIIHRISASGALATCNNLYSILNNSRSCPNAFSSDLPLSTCYLSVYCKSCGCSRRTRESFSA